MIWTAGWLVDWLKSRPRLLWTIDFSFAGVFAFFAVKIAFTQGRS